MCSSDLERATIGGYTKIACVITADLPKAAQSKAGDVLRFQAVNINEAHKILFELNNKLRELEARINNIKNYAVKINNKIYQVSIEKLN